jgi:hypothetical protein
MKRAVCLYSLVFICLIVARTAFAHSDAKAACPFSIVGLWRMEGATEATRIFFDFSPAGYVTLLGYSPDALPQEFEMMDSVNYRLDKRAAPRQLYHARSGIRATNAMGQGADAPVFSHLRRPQRASPAERSRILDVDCHRRA